MNRRRRSAGSRAAGVRPPALVVAIAVAGLLVFFVAPLAGLVQRAPWSNVWSDLSDPVSRTALRLSLAAGEVTIAASAGLAMFPEHGGDPDQLVAAADAALYRAKRAGRGRACLHRVGLEG